MDDRPERAGRDRLAGACALILRSGSRRRPRSPRARASFWISGLLLALVFGTFPEASAIRGEDWLPVTAGVDYRAYVLGGPVRVYVARMDIDQTQVIVESSIGGGGVGGGLETVSGMARRYDQSLTAWGGAWGPRGRVAVAINGSSFDPETSTPYGGLLHSGWYALRYGSLAGGSGFVWTAERDAAIRGCVENDKDRQVITRLSTGERTEFDSVNLEREDDGLILFTPQYSPETPSGEREIEAVVRVERPLGIVPLPRRVLGTLVEVRDGHGGTPILFDEVVLAGKGPFAESYLRNLSQGEALGFSQEITDLGFGCGGGGGFDWSKAYAGIGGGFVFLRNGEVHHSDDLGSDVHDPRTAVCLGDEFVYFVVVDGRKPGFSRGMTLDELALFCRDDLGASWGLNQDGGGSSAMWVDGQIVNSPSDGHERPVANGLLIMSVEPAFRSTRFSEGFRVDVQLAGDVRLGPGGNQSVIGQARPGEVVRIASTAPSLQGVFASGSFWWKVEHAGELGWIAEQSLVRPNDALGVFQLPTPPWTWSGTPSN